MQPSARAWAKSEERSSVPAPTNTWFDASTWFDVSWRSVAFLGMAGLFFTLAVLGVFLPGIPATPFLLLTSYFLARSSPRLNAALLASRLFRPILVDWQVHGGVRTHVRFKSIAVVVFAVTTTIYFSGPSLPLTLAVVSFAAVGIVVILRLPAVREA